MAAREGVGGLSMPYDCRHCRCVDGRCAKKAGGAFEGYSFCVLTTMRYICT